VVMTPPATTITTHDAESDKARAQHPAQVVTTTTTQLSPVPTNPLVTVLTDGGTAVNRFPPSALLARATLPQLGVLAPHTSLARAVPVLTAHVSGSVLNLLHELEAGPVSPAALAVAGAASGARLGAAVQSGLIELAMALTEPLLPPQPTDPLTNYEGIPSSMMSSASGGLYSPPSAAAVLALVAAIIVVTKTEVQSRSLLVPSSLVLDITNPPG